MIKSQLSFLHLYCPIVNHIVWSPLLLFLPIFPKLSPENEAFPTILCPHLKHHQYLPIMQSTAPFSNVWKSRETEDVAQGFIFCFEKRFALRGISSGENNLRKHLRKWPSKKFWLVLQIHIQSKLFRRSFSKVFSKVIFAGRETPLWVYKDFFYGGGSKKWWEIIERGLL